MMLAAYERIFAVARERRASIVADWGCLGMVEDLPCAQPDRRSVTSRDPTARADRNVLVSHARDVLDAWGDRCVLFVLDAGARVPARDEGFIARDTAIVEAHRAARWDVHQLDATHAADDVLHEAFRTLRVSQRDREV
jgi:hypothetical protein